MSNKDLKSPIFQPTGSLTQRLLQSEREAFDRATRAPFLQAAGQGQVSRKTLSQWFSQDRLYAQAYIGFIGALLSYVQLPEYLVTNHEDSLQWRIVDLLTLRLENTHRKLRFLSDVADKYSLDLECPWGNKKYPTVADFGASPVTESYTNLFRSFLTPGKSLLEGMVVLWATETCALYAWLHAKYQGLDPQGARDLDGGALRNEIIPNWTSDDSVKFVEDIESLVDEMGKRSWPEKIERAVENTFGEVLSIEEAFWPKMAKEC